MNAIPTEAARGAEDLELVALVAHELKGPLACIQGYAQLLMDPSARSGMIDEKTMVERIALGCRHAASLLDNLVCAAAAPEADPGRAAEGRLLEHCDAREVFRDSFSLFEVVARSAQVALSPELPDEPVHVALSEHRLRQVLQNLVSNALRHTPSGGSVELRLETSRGRALVRVSDSGEGIAAEDLSRLFERFFQGRDRRGSLGLGLFVVKRIVEEAGGTVAAESDGPGRGATFSLSLPLREQESLVERIPVRELSIPALTAAKAWLAGAATWGGAR